MGIFENEFSAQITNNPTQNLWISFSFSHDLHSERYIIVIIRSFNY